VQYEVGGFLRSRLLDMKQQTRDAHGTSSTGIIYLQEKKFGVDASNRGHSKGGSNTRLSHVNHHCVGGGGGGYNKGVFRAIAGGRGVKKRGIGHAKSKGRGPVYQTVFL